MSYNVVLCLAEGVRPLRGSGRWIALFCNTCDRRFLKRCFPTPSFTHFAAGVGRAGEEQLNGEKPLTAFGKSCQKLGIEIIKAYSPQAKGRVERRNGVFHDRLVKELNLKEIREIDAANCFLREGYEAGLNRKFSVPPVEEQDAHRLLQKGLHLKDLFCFEESRRVNNDWTIQYQSCFFQIRRENKVRPNAGQRVVVRRDLEGTLTLHYKGQKVFYDALEKRPQKLELNTKPKSRTIHHPASDHPWRKCFMATKELKEATV